MICRPFSALSGIAANRCPGAGARAKDVLIAGPQKEERKQLARSA
jgi:hypothetical protein